jgi:hypothetical protein
MAETQVTLTYTVEVVKDDMTENELKEWIDENHIQGGLDVGLQNDADIENCEINMWE